MIDKETLIKRFEDRKDKSINTTKEQYELQGQCVGLNEYQSVALLKYYIDNYNRNFKKLKEIINNLDNEKIKKLIDEIDNFKDNLDNENYVIEHTLYALDEVQFLEKTKTKFDKRKTKQENSKLLWSSVKRQKNAFIKNIDSNNVYQVRSVRLPKPKKEIEYKLTRALKDLFTDNELLKDYVTLILDREKFEAKKALEDNSKTLTTKEEYKELFKDVHTVDLSDPRA